MGQADYLRVGDWNIRCDRCGKKMKGSEAVETWDHLKVCRRCYEPRHPQDFVRAVVEHPEPPFVRNPPDVILPTPGEAIVSEATWMPWEDIDYLLTEDDVWMIQEEPAVYRAPEPIYVEQSPPSNNPWQDHILDESGFHITPE